MAWSCITEYQHHIQKKEFFNIDTINLLKNRQKIINQSIEDHKFIRPLSNDLIKLLEKVFPHLKGNFDHRMNVAIQRDLQYLYHKNVRKIAGLKEIIYRENEDLKKFRNDHTLRNDPSELCLYLKSHSATSAIDLCHADNLYDVNPKFNFPPLITRVESN